MALQPAAKLGKKCNACGTWNRPHPVGNHFDPGQKCFMANCKCILYQGLPKDKYPGKHHRPSGPKGSRADGTSSVESAGTALRHTRQPVVPAVGAHVPSTSSPWGANRYNKMLKDMEALKKENKLLKAKGSDKESEPESAEAAGNDHSKAVKDCRAYLAKCKAKVAEAEKEEEEEPREVLLGLWKPLKAKAEEALQAALDSQQAAKPVDQRQRELEKEVRRLEGSCKQQDSTNADLLKNKEEAIAAEAAGLEKATSLKEQLVQAKKKLEAARQEQAPAEVAATSPERQPQEGEGQDEYAQRRLEMLQISLPQSMRLDEVKQAEMRASFIKEFNDIKTKANSSGTPALPAKADEDEDADMEVDIDSVEDSILDELLVCSGFGGDSESTSTTPAERRNKQRQHLKEQKQEDGPNRVLQNLIKSKRGGAGAAAKS